MIFLPIVVAVIVSATKAAIEISVDWQRVKSPSRARRRIWKGRRPIQSLPLKAKHDLDHIVKTLRT